MIKFDEPVYQTEKIYEHIINAKIKKNRITLSRKKIKFKVLRRIERFKNSKKYFHNLHNVKYTDNVKDSLIGCYNTKAEYFELIKVLLNQSKDNTNSIYNIKCPYCSINNANTIDHILPKELYPEFSFAPGNLIYVCHDCNSKKGIDYKNENNRIIINPYRDSFIDEIYVKVNLDLYPYNMKYKLIAHLEIDTSNCTNEDSIIINNHYKKLNLLRLLNDELPSLLSELENSFYCNSYSNQMKTYSLHYDSSSKTNGVNHYKTALYRTLITTEIIKEFYEKNKLVIV